MKKKILFVGEAPYSFTGNANMMSGLLASVDTDKFEVSCFGAGESELKGDAVFHTSPYSTIPASKNNDYWGLTHLAEVVASINFDILFMVGVDLWRYAPVYEHLYKLRAVKGFKWVALFPYDLVGYRRDWGEWINLFDLPLVYSEYGLRTLKPYHPGIQYFRPPLFGADIFTSFDQEKRFQERRNIFPKDVDRFIYGFMGKNQIRKDPLRFLEAFSFVHKKHPDTAVYMHHEDQGEKGVYSVRNAASDFGFPPDTILIKKAGRVYSQVDMVRIYNALNCTVNTSFQEGLSWTVLESMLCGCPVIASDTTAHPELVNDVGSLVPCTDRIFIPIAGLYGNTHQPAVACNVEDLIKEMEFMYRTPVYQSECKEKGLLKGKEWLEGVSDINKIFEEVSKKESPLTVKKDKEPAILFAQKMSAGDILMTTQCLRGLKDRHKGLPLVYMTSKKYMGILEDNPDIDQILEWDNQLKRAFQFYYNPHEDRIQPGHWGRNSNSILSDFYWKILAVEPSPIFIAPEEPPLETLAFLRTVKKPICAIYSAGIDRPFREYQYMNSVCKGLSDRYFTVQMGGHDDYPAQADCDLRGKLTYRQEAWLAKQASLGITVDTFGAHLLGAFGVSQVTLPGSSNSRVVCPKQFGGKQIIMDPDYVRVCPGLGPCSAAVRDCPAPCIGSISPQDILKAVTTLEKEG